MEGIRMFQSGSRKDDRTLKIFFLGCLMISVLCLAVSIGGAQSSSGSAPQNPAPPEKTAGEAFKNIQVLKDIPASQLVPGMRYITTALGVRCEFCHVNPFEKDDQREKQTARQMIKMMFDLNKANFGGRTEISCYTCHHGHAEPVSLVALPSDASPATLVQAAPSAPTTPLLSADELLNKYTQALGGREALEKISSRIIKAQQIGPDKSSHPQEVYQKGPNKVLTVTTSGQSASYTGFDGTRVWTTSNRGQTSDPKIVISHRDAGIDPATALRHYTDARVMGRQKIDDREVVAMRAKAPDGFTEFLFFDADSGLLVRRSLRMQTVFGALPLQISYADYRKVDGVAVPFKTTWWVAEGSWSRVVDEVQDNSSIEDTKFEKAPDRP
jgi:hypothetical protein